jgi:septal ring-binding cell division protein DamX
MEANKELLPQLEPFRLKLGGILTQALDAGKQQAALKASKQESSKQFRRLLTDGQRVANVIRTAVKDHFGPREEKVAEFGLQPFRGRKVKAATPAPTTPATEKPTSTTSPAPAGPATPTK